ncbi:MULTISPECIES: hypothetical protein [unclassified Mesorhizobium]|nr:MULTISPECIES: hypothetical protein [unclassified Mesorhizobium]
MNDEATTLPAERRAALAPALARATGSGGMVGGAPAPLRRVPF